MSAQTIILPSVKSMKTKAEIAFVKNADKYLLKQMYSLGDSYCRNNQYDSVLIHDIISTNNCELLEQIKTELGKSETIVSLGSSRGYSNDILQNSEDALYELWKGEGNVGTKTDFLNRAFLDEKANWDEIKW